MSAMGQTKTSTRPGATPPFATSTDIISLARHVRQVPEHRISRGTVDRVFADPLLWPDPHTVNENELEC
jgi:hypothetical protein